MAKPAIHSRPEHSRSPDPIDVEVGLNLRRVRRDRGLSQAEVGDALGITFQQVQKYERGANRVSASMLVKAARFLGVRAADLLPEEDKTRSTDVLLRRVADTPAAGKAVEAFCAIPSPGLRRTVLQLMKALGSAGEGVSED
jgi:transcriptional regulator with XRE-family HTH domain